MSVNSRVPKTDLSNGLFCHFLPTATIPAATVPAATIPAATIPAATVPAATVPVHQSRRVLLSRL